MHTVRETPFLPPKGRENALHNHAVAVGNLLAEESSGATNKPNSTTLQVYRVSRTAFRLPDPKARIPWLGPEAEVPVPNDAPVFPLALFHPGYLPRRPRKTALTSVSGVAGAPLRAPHRADTLDRVRARFSPAPVLHARWVIRCAPTGGPVPSSAELRRV